MRFPLPALLLLCALLPAGGCITIGPPAPWGEEVRVLVYNVHAGRDAAGAPSLEQVARVVRETRADLVLLQEVDSATERSGRVDQAAELARLTGLSAAFGGNLDFQGGRYGLALLSRWPIVRDTVVPLPSAPAAGAAPEPRGVLRAVVAVPDDTLDVLVTHLDASAQDAHRLVQVDSVRSLADRLENAGRTVIVGGDFNAPPDGEVVARMERTGWRDAWRTCGTGEGPTFPAAAPTRRIDFLFLRAVLQCDEARVIESAASDHRPVLFVLSRRNLPR